MTIWHTGPALHRKRDPRKVGKPITPMTSRNGQGHLFDVWPQVARRIKSAHHLALFLDFDGTLTRLRPRPEDVPPLDPLRHRLLRHLASRPQLDVYVISGRRIADLRSRVRVPGVRLLRLYGWEGRAVPPMRKERELVQQAKRLLAPGLARLAGVQLEDKKLGLGVHYRGAPPAEVRSARAAVRRVLERFKPQLRILQEKKACQLVHRAVGGKGSAMRSLLGRYRRPTLAIFAGDDAGDEPAFAVLRHGITVHVGSQRRTRARFYLRNPGEVLTFLRRLEVEIA